MMSSVAAAVKMSVSHQRQARPAGGGDRGRHDDDRGEGGIDHVLGGRDGGDLSECAGQRRLVVAGRRAQHRGSIPTTVTTPLISRSRITGAMVRG